MQHGLSDKTLGLHEGKLKQSDEVVFQHTVQARKALKMSPFMKFCHTLGNQSFHRMTVGSWKTDSRTISRQTLFCWLTCFGKYATSRQSTFLENMKINALH